MILTALLLVLAALTGSSSTDVTGCPLTIPAGSDYRDDTWFGPDGDVIGHAVTEDECVR